MLDVHSLVKYLLEGVAVAVAAYYLTNKRTNPQEVLMLGVIAAATFLILDQFAPAVAGGARQGAGFGVGYQLVGGGDDEEPFADEL